MVSLLAGVATFLSDFSPRGASVGDRVALVVAWLCAVSPILVLFSIYARAYALLVLTCALSLWALAALLERPSCATLAAWGLGASACLWTHYFAVFVLAGEIGVLAVRLPRERTRLALVLMRWPPPPSRCGPSSAPRAAPPNGPPTSPPSRSRAASKAIVRQFAMGTNVPAAWLEGAGIAIVALAVALRALARAPARVARCVLVAVIAVGAGVPILGALTKIDDHLLARNVLGVWICVAPLAAFGLMRAARRAAGRLQRDRDRHGDRRPERLALPGLDGLERRERADPRPGGRRRRSRCCPGSRSTSPGSTCTARRSRAPIATRDLWVMVEPARGAGERALDAGRRSAARRAMGRELPAPAARSTTAAFA